MGRGLLLLLELLLLVLLVFVDGPAVVSLMPELDELLPPCVPLELRRLVPPLAASAMLGDTCRAAVAVLGAPIAPAAVLVILLAGVGATAVG